MPTYHVRWSIDIPAVSAEAAAGEALRIQRDPDGIATVFGVRELLSESPRRLGREVEIDLDPEA